MAARHVYVAGWNSDMDHLDKRPFAATVRALMQSVGVLPDDPLGPLIEKLAELPEETRSALAPVLAEMQVARGAITTAASKPVTATLSDQHVADLGARLAQQHHTHVNDLIRAENLRSWAMMVCAAVALLIAVGSGWWLHAAIAPRQPVVSNCSPEPQASGEAWSCTFWTRLPTPGAH